MMDLPVYTFSESCLNAKRLYSDALFKWDCPNCKKQVDSQFNKTPLISYGSYCHVFYCEYCNYESSEKMYSLNAISEGEVSIDISESNNLKVYMPTFELIER